MSASNILLFAIQALHLDVESYEEKVIEAKQMADMLRAEENFLAEKMTNKTDAAYER